VTGTEQYAIHLIRALIRLNDGSHTLTLYFRDAPPPDLFPTVPGVTLRVIPWRHAWTHVRFAAALWAERPDVTFVPAHTLPFVFPGRAVVTVHDLGYRVFPQAHKTRDRLYLDLTTRFSAWRATRVLADSQATADDLTRFYSTPAGKIHVVYPGVEPLQVGDIAAVRARYGLPDRYFLFLGTLQPRKNIARIVQAYARFRETHGDEIGLVLAGAPGWLYEPAWTSGVAGVTLTGYVDDADRGTLYGGAEALVFPSLYEGFGFPVLEALHAGIPVIASRTSSLPELVGDAGQLVDPLDVDGIAAALARVQRDPERGRAQAGKFTWDAAARAVLAVLAAIARE
jgi:glycosyltransferase involved in cell wall biosynthesis